MASSCQQKPMECYWPEKWEYHEIDIDLNFEGMIWLNFWTTTHWTWWCKSEKTTMKSNCDKHSFHMYGTLFTLKKRLWHLPNAQYPCNGVSSRKKGGTTVSHNEPLVMEHHDQKCWSSTLTWPHVTKAEVATRSWHENSLNCNKKIFNVEFIRPHNW